MCIYYINTDFLVLAYMYLPDTFMYTSTPLYNMEKLKLLYYNMYIIHARACIFFIVKHLYGSNVLLSR